MFWREKKEEEVGGLEMGVNAFRFSSCEGCKPKHACEAVVREEGSLDIESARKLPNPDPGDFKIERLMPIGDFLLARVCYLGCTNFEGVKILLYRGVSMSQLTSVESLDPHFVDSKFSPIARFVPTVEGWVMGEMFAKMLLSKESPREMEYGSNV